MTAAPTSRRRRVGSLEVLLLALVAATAANYGEETWIQVEGEVVPGSADAGNDFIPTLTAATVTRIDKPANTYAY